MSAMYGFCVLSVGDLEIYEQTLLPADTAPRFFWRSISKGKTHGPFGSITEAHLHYDIFLKAIEAPDYLNVIFVDFKAKRRVS